MTSAGQDPDRVGRRILVANHQLEIRAGSELVTLEVAEALSHRGHAVALFTLHPGDLATEFSARTGIEVLHPGRVNEVLDFAPEGIHAHHWPTLAFLRRFGVDAPAVMGFLGVLPDLEHPPPLPSGSEIPWWAVSEEVAASVRGVGGWNGSPSVIIRNWYDDRLGMPSPRTGASDLRRLLVVSNHFPTELLARLTRVADRVGASVEHIGLPDNPRPIDDPLLASFDAVVTLGRTAVTCLANGIPVLVLDEGGGDGWVTAQSVAELALCNFSGRAHRLAPTSQQLASWLDSPPTAEDLSQLRGWVTREALLSTSMDRLEGLYQAAAAGAAKNDLGRWSRVVGDYVLDRHTMSNEVRRLAAESAEVQAHGDQLAADLAASRDEVTRGQVELAAARREVSALADLRDEILESASWRMTAPIRASKRLVQDRRMRAPLITRRERAAARRPE